MSRVEIDRSVRSGRRSEREAPLPARGALSLYAAGGVDPDDSMRKRDARARTLRDRPATGPALRAAARSVCSRAERSVYISRTAAELPRPAATTAKGDEWRRPSAFIAAARHSANLALVDEQLRRLAADRRRHGHLISIMSTSRAARLKPIAAAATGTMGSTPGQSRRRCAPLRRRGDRPSRTFERVPAL